MYVCVCVCVLCVDVFVWIDWVQFWVDNNGENFITDPPN